MTIVVNGIIIVTNRIKVQLIVEVVMVGHVYKLVRIMMMTFN